jgi:hypothetical protein
MPRDCAPTVPRFRELHGGDPEKEANIIGGYFTRTVHTRASFDAIEG